MSYNSQSSDFASYLEEYLMYKHHTYTSQYDPKFDLKINVGHSDLHIMVQLFCLISEYLMYKDQTYESV